ncbi:MAG: hypothetical protein AYL29_007150 [Candidatus Bathyarchaeota archaeon B24]|nr:MAG: hypothetical protein AYL29_007150 [Candidatus Bathyarchaeota archaeon B24]
MVLDGSGSISSDDWQTIVEGVADAIRNNLPHDGSVELTIVQFGYADPTYAKVEVGPIVITDANYEDVALQVESISQSGDMTPMAHGLYLGWKTIKESNNFTVAERQVINLATDGVPNVRNFNATDDLDGDGDVNEYDDVIAVVQNAVAEGLDELDMEGINIGSDAVNWFRDYVLYPQPGHVAPPFIPGWIMVVADAQEFADTVGEKFEVVIEGPPEKPVGGAVFPINVFAVAAPWMLAALAAIVMAVWILMKRGYIWS